MGYNTDFKGELLFTKELDSTEMLEIEKFLDEDCRYHPEWNPGDLIWIDLCFNRDLTGIEWNGGEKTYDLTEKVNLIISNMQQKFPDFGLTGELLAQGEDMTDRWRLVIENGRAVKKPVKILGDIIECPHCGEKIILDELENEEY